MLFLSCLIGAACAQTPPNIDPASETGKLKEFCFSQFVSCAQELFTGDPLHFAVGSIAPQDGFGGGLAYVGQGAPGNWRITWSGDGIVSNNLSWRAGFYATLLHTGQSGLGSYHFGTSKVKPNYTSLPEHLVINLYLQTISLNKLTYFGLGPTSSEADRSFYGMTETISGLNGVKPLGSRLSAAIYGEVNGRFVSIRGSDGQPSPSIGQLYTEANAPGLTHQPGFLQLGEGIRLRPVLFDDFLRLNYDLGYREYLAPGDSHYSFERLTVDLNHQFAIYRKTTRVLWAREGNTPDSCALTADNPVCSLDKKALYKTCVEDKNSTPDSCKAISRDLQGSISVRALLSLSMTPGGSVVPFYFQQTLGGMDINGNPSLTSYQDYRFRAPDLLLFQQTFEHSIKGPVGFYFGVDEGAVSLTRGGLASPYWLHSYSTGLTLRVGGIPQVFLLFSFGGNEGTHTIANVNTSLLGGAARPAL